MEATVVLQPTQNDIPPVFPWSICSKWTNKSSSHSRRRDYKRSWIPGGRNHWESAQRLPTKDTIKKFKKDIDKEKRFAVHITNKETLSRTHKEFQESKKRKASNQNKK